jgi:beta-galactosidase
MLHRSRRRNSRVYLAEALEPRELLSFTPPVDPRVVTSLDSGWKFIRQDVTNAHAITFNDSTWTSISVPHTWNNLDGQDGGSDYYRGIGWYRRHITPSASLAGKSLYLKFDGADLVTDVYINGTLIGEHDGGYSAFGWDVTSFLTIGADNVIAVKVNNALNNNIAPLAGDYTMDGGIYRHVNLIATNPQHVALQEFVPADTSANPVGPTVSYFLNTPGVYLTQTSVSSSSANLAITTDVRNDAATAKTLTVVSDIVDAAGNLVRELNSSQSVGASSNVDFVQSTVLSNPHLWNGVKDPYLYSVYVSVKSGTTLTDVLQQSLGFRSFSVDPNLGAILNGQPYDLHGVDFHQDRLNEGWAISDADQTQDVGLIQEIGATFVRLSHYQHPELTYQLLDQDGIAAWSEVPINGTGNANLPSTTAFLNNAKQQLQEMIRQEYNHPSILVWGLFNEINDNATNRSVITALNNLAHQEDPTRLTTAASNNDPSAPVAQIPNVAGFNEYFGWYSGVISDIGPWLDSEHAANPTRAIGLSEYGAGASVIEHEENATEPDNASNWHPEEYQDLFHEEYWAALESRPFVWEKTVWNMFDFAVDSRDEGDTAGRNDKGLVTYDRKTKKDAFYFYKANWSSSPVLYITSRQFTTRASNNIAVKIYANMDSVTLSVNGVTIGTINSASAPEKIFLWNNIALQPGPNQIQVTGTRAGQNYSDSVTWTYTPPLQTLSAMTGTPFARINFQPSTSSSIPGYDADNGLVFGARPDGLSYGWNVDETANARERTSGFIGSPPPDPRYARFIHMERNGAFFWEIAVPNGTYDVHIVGGDPGFTDSTYGIDLEGRLALSGTPTTSNLWLESIVRVSVTDGRLTLSNDAAGVNSKIDYIDINTTTPFAFVQSNRLFVNFQGFPISLGMQSGKISATSGATTLNFDPATFADALVTGSTSDTVTLNGGSFTFAGGTSPGLSLVLNGGAALMMDASESLTHLTISGGQLFVKAGGAGPLRVQTINLTGGLLDLADNSLIIDATPATAVRPLLVSGFNGGAWDGSGIDSSTAASDVTHLHALGYAEASDLGVSTFMGQSVGPGAVLIRYTPYGDNNLDGTVDIGNDFAMLLDGLAAKNASSWVQGDYTFDNKVDLGNDFNLYLRSYLGAALNHSSEPMHFSAQPQVAATSVAAMPPITTLPSDADNLFDSERAGGFQ